MDKLLELAERCERATGPNGELDADIAVAALGYVEVLSDEGDWRSFIGPKGRVNVLRDGEVASPELPRLTASLDAAITLVPEGQAIVLAFNAARLADAQVNWKYAGLAKTPALALCAAALRARATQGSASDG